MRFPTTLYFLYHPVTLPNFGQLVAFGGVTPNVCHNSTLALGFKEGHIWPCLVSELRTRLANVAGPEGWKWLIHPDGKILLCLFFFACYLAFLAMVMAEPRKPRFDAHPCTKMIDHMDRWKSTSADPITEILPKT
jgi:hypothetical protein